MLTHAHSRLLFRGPEFDARRAWQAAVTRLREVACGIGGHEYYLRSTSEGMFLRCLACGHKTPGWRIEIRARPARTDVRA
jgi:hypothetical protein